MSEHKPIECVRRLQFCAGHRVMGHENKCAHLHGHNYVVYLHARALYLDDVGRVIDFSVLKKLFGDWIDEHWDHGFILNEDDATAIDLVANFSPNEAHKIQQKIYILPYNPTAENLAHYLLTRVAPKLLRKYSIELVRVVVHETENCYATIELED